MRSILAFLALSACACALAQNAPFPPSPHVLVAVNPVTNKVYIANEFANSVTVLNGATNTTNTIPVGNRPQFIAVNPVTNRVFVNNGGDASLTVIDGATDTNLTPTALPVGSQGPMAVNVETNMVYIVRMTSVATDEVTYFNAANNTWYTIATESFQPTALAVNPATNTLYVAHYGTGDVRIISAANDGNAHPTTFSIGAWSKPFAVAANSMTNRIYVITEDTRGPIGIIDGASRTAVFPVPTAGHGVSPKALAVNPVTNRIYAAFAGEVIVINGATNAYTYVPVDTGSGAASIAIDYYRNNIYVSNAAGTLTVIDGATNATSTLGIPAGTVSIGMNPITNEVIAAGGTTGIVDGVNGTVSSPPVVTTITPLPSNASGPSGSITMNAANGFANALPIRGVYFQMDSTEGAWTAATGSGPYTATFSGLSPGPHTLKAFAVEAHVASTDTGPQASPLVGAIASYAFTVSGSLATPRVDLASSQNPSSIGQPVTFTATVSGSAGTPTGTVSFDDGGTVVAGCSSVTLVSGSAACTPSSLAAGAHTITASYSGNASYGTGSASVMQTVNKLTAAVSLLSSSNPSTTGDPVTFTASVTGGGATPTGTVTFKDGATPISGCPAVALTSGSAACTTRALTVGSHTINAEYGGSATYDPDATSLSQTVQDPPPPPPPPPTLLTSRLNVALAANGGTVTASSTSSADFPAASLIDGERAGVNWGAGGGWRDATPFSYPDSVEIAFAGARTIDTVVVYSLQDAFDTPVQPSETMTFSRFGATAFSVDAWNGAAWIRVADISGNSLVKRAVTFSPVTTTRIRVTINATPSNYSRLTEIEAFTVDPTSARKNVALASNGASASAATTGGAAFPASSLIDGDRAGRTWGMGGGWRDSTANTYPDPVEIAFGGTKAIDTVIVYSLQDDPASAVEPTASTTFTTYGATGFTVEAWNGSAWTLLATVTGNNLVKRAVAFQPVETTKIRVQVTSTPSNYSRLVEVAALGVDAGPARTNHALAANGASVTASSTGGTTSPSSGAGMWFPAASLTDGDRRGANWGAGGGWRDSTANEYPDWVEIAFAGTKTVDTVIVYSLQDDSTAPVEPYDTMTFATFGTTAFTVEAWNGSAWISVGNVTGNNLVKRAVTFAPVATTKVRVTVNATVSNYSRLVEIEAWGGG